MRWPSFAIAAFVTVVIQIGLGRFIGLGPQRIFPDLLLMIAMILALHGPRDQVALAGWILGLAKDLSSQAPLGCYAVGFGLAVWALLQVRRWFYAESPLALITLTFLAGVLVEQFALAVCIVKGLLPGESYGSMTIGLVFSAALTGALAPYGQWALMKFHRQLGLPRRGFYHR